MSLPHDLLDWDRRDVTLPIPSRSVGAMPTLLRQPCLQLLGPVAGSVERISCAQA